MNVHQLLQQRALGVTKRHTKTNFSPHESLVQRLEHTVLEGHGGCVNRLAWNRQGTFLASGSDDRRILIWDAGSTKIIEQIATGHSGNIFGVRFIPGTNDRWLCSGAMDHEVRVHAIETKRCPPREYYCHTDRVKDVQTSEQDANIFWSASEDGTARQFDIRLDHKCVQRGETRCDNRIVNLRRKRIELKGLSINPVFPMYIAFACGDQYLRVYDRRMLSNETEMLTGCVKKYTPAHLKKKNASVHATYIKYSDDGAQLLASYHGEHVYMFDTTNCSSTQFEKPQSTTSLRDIFKALNESRNNQVVSLRKEGNDAFQSGQFHLAISKYSEAILESPHTSTLYSNRAIAFIKREWKSDYHMAIRDCDTALQLDKTNIKARYRKAKALSSLKDYDKALEWIDGALELYPTNTDFQELKKECAGLKEKHDEKNQHRRHLGDVEDSDDSDVDADAGDQSEEEKEECDNPKPVLRTDFLHRFTGHCNVKTDIKEATFFGNYIVSGSDDGRVFIWEKRTGTIVNILNAAENVVVNCCQPHPHFPILATSGIENTIKLWSPSAEQPCTLSDSQSIMNDNQKTLEAGLRPYALVDTSLLAYIRALLATDHDIHHEDLANN